MTASRSCAAAGTSIKGLRLESGGKARAARHYMVISCGNLPGELYHGRARQTMPACPLGTKYHHQERGWDAGGGRVGLDGGDITKMSENVTHLIIYAPRSRRYPRSSLSLRPSSSSLSLYPSCAPVELSVVSSTLTSPPRVPASAGPTLRVQCRRRILARN